MEFPLTPNLDLNANQNKNLGLKLEKIRSCDATNKPNIDIEKKGEHEGGRTRKLERSRDSISNIRRIRRIGKGGSNFGKERHKKKINTKKKWDCYRGLVKGAHRIFKMVQEIQLYGYPNYNLEENERELQRLSRSLLLKTEKANQVVKEDKDCKLPWYLLHPENQLKAMWSMLMVWNHKDKDVRSFHRLHHIWNSHLKKRRAVLQTQNTV